MRKHRFFCSQDFTIDASIDLDQEISHQVTRVLRLQPGDVIYLFNNSGFEYSASIEDISRKTVSVKITAAIADTQESNLLINLAQVVGKGDKMDLVIQKATELGVHSITPLYSIRSVSKNIVDKSPSKLMHWSKIAAAASCQCWRNFVPTINPAQDLAAWLNESPNELSKEQLKIILAPEPGATRIKELKITHNICLLVGPEGGFDDVEINLAVQHGFTAVNLGPRILRTETAGIAAIAILQAIFGDI